MTVYAQWRRVMMTVSELAPARLYMNMVAPFESGKGFNRLLFPVPTRIHDLQELCAKFNEHYNTSYTLAELDPNGLKIADSIPQVDDQTGGTESLFTTACFVVGTTAGNYQQFAAIEMDDAIIAKACASIRIQFGFVRNLSDPV
jgi:hypothetical protein